MTYQEALDYLHAVSWKGSQPGLSRITSLMARLGNPERQLKFIHVVGTNGKGSTSAMLASVLRAAGYRTGLFTSPYLVDFRERMQIDGQMIPEDELAQMTEAARPHIDEMHDTPTEFERITAIAFMWFAERRCDVVVLEAGMGGEFDATNVISGKELAVFTNIGLDHTEYLGNTVEQIAATKAGILTSGCAAVLYPNSAAVQAVVENACEKVNVPLYIPSFSEITEKSADLTGQQFDFSDFNDLFLPLLGAHQLRNAAVALTAVEVLRARGWAISPDAVRAGLASVHWPGRFEVAEKEPLLLLDGGHNAQCIDALCAALDTYLPNTPLTVLTGVLADKDYPKMYAALAPYAARFVTVAPTNPRALSADALAAHLSRYGKPVTACETAQQALACARAFGDPVLCCGSLYLVGEVKSLLQR